MSLPHQLTSFIGRETELAEVLGVARRSRLVTLTGPGGVGKTRLALEAATRLQEQDEIVSVYFVDLAPLREPDRLEGTLIVALGGSQAHRSVPLEKVVGLIAASRSLLVIDNCEHLVDPISRIVDRLVRGAPGLRVFATSREPFDIAGEARYAVPPLNGEDGVRLFMERAQLVNPRLAPMEDSKSTVLQLCRGLDGLPLAIELAAARVGQMPIGEILARLDDRFALLTKNSRTAVRRHQTLEAAIGWSHDLLDGPERASFACLSVFAGGFDPSAGKEVARCSLDVLGRLVDKSMVVASAGVDGRARYRLLETLQQFAYARLEESGQAAHARRRHFDHFAALAGNAAAELHGPKQVLWMDRLGEERANLRVALECGRRTDPDAALAMAVDLSWFWHHRGHYVDGRSWLVELASIAPAPRPETLAAALTQAADFAFLLGDRATAALELDRALELWRGLGDPGGISRTLVAQAVAASPGLAELAERRPLLEEAVSEARRAGSEHLLVEALIFLGRAEDNAGNLEQCLAHLREAETIARRAGDAWRLAFVLYNQSQLDHRQNQLEAAAARLAESLKLQHATRSTLLGGIHVALGFVRIDQYQDAEARQNFEAALTFEDIGLPEASAVRGLALLAGRKGSFQRALKLHGAYWSMPWFGFRGPATKLEMQPWFGAARRALGRDVADAMWHAGAAMTTPEALAYALSDADEPPAPDSPLTAREREIAVLVARGRRNREIAEQLYISPRTVDAHVEHIRNKLGYQSRSQVAAWANEQGLLKAQRNI